MSGEPQPGDVFAEHEIEAEIGRGGMGVVYRARSLALDRVRALKLIAAELSRDSAYAARFRRESRLAASLEHPHVVTVHHAGEEDGMLYLVLRYVDGPDLSDLLASGPLDAGRALRVIAGVAAALDAAHAQGLVHRDVKPGNVLLEGAGADEHAFLTDFGISKLAASSDAATTTLTQTGVFVGTPDYVAPEQIEGEAVDARADVYSLSCMVFEALAGRSPFRRGTDLATLLAQGNDERPLLSRERPELGALDEALRAGMAVDPGRRPARAGELAAALAEALEADRSPAPPTRAETAPRTLEETAARTGATRTLRRRLPLRAAIGGLATAAMAAVALALALGGGEESSPRPDQAPEAEVVPAAATIDVGRDPVDVAAGGINVWVAARGAGAVEGIDPGRDEPATRVENVDSPHAVATGHGSIWALSGSDLLRLDPGEGRREEIGGLSDPSDLAVGPDFVWVADRGPSPRVVQVDPGSGSIVDQIPVGLEPRAIAVGEGAIWVANAGDGTVSEIDPVEGRTVGRPIPAGRRPTSIAAGAGSVWVTDNLSGEMVRIDPNAGAPVGEPIVTGNKPRGVTVGFGRVWVAHGEDGTVWSFDPATGEHVGDVVRVGEDPADIDAGFGAVWTADSGSSTVTRIDP